MRNAIVLFSCLLACAKAEPGGDDVMGRADLGLAELGLPVDEVDEVPPVLRPENIQATDGFQAPDYGMTYASADRGVEYQFFAESPLEPELGPFLWVIYSEQGNAKRWEKVFLDFLPSAIYAHTNQGNQVLVGGQANDGTTILVEFEFQLTDEFKVLKRAEPFADVSQLGSLCNLWGINFRGREMLFVLDGRFGKWGTVERGQAFDETSTLEQRSHLIGKRHFIQIYSDLLDLRVGFSSQLPGACVDEPEEAWFRLESLDYGKSFHELSLEDAGRLLWDRVFEEPQSGVESLDGENRITYEFWGDKSREERGNILDVTFSNGWVGAESFTLDFIPTAILCMKPRTETILIGGKNHEGHTVLTEMEFESRNGVIKILRQEKFAEVSELGGIATSPISELMGRTRFFFLTVASGVGGRLTAVASFRKFPPRAKGNN